MPYPSCRSSHPRCEPRPFPTQEGLRRRTDRSHPAWGRSEATQTGGVLLAPLPGECKCRLAGTHKPGLAGTEPPRISAMRIALYQPDIPQNTGTVLRLCACLGVEAHIIAPAGFPTSDRAFRRAGMDYLHAVTIVRHASGRDFEAWRQIERPRRVLFTTGAAMSYLDSRFEPADVLLFGRESAGVPPEVHSAADARLVIPMRPGLRSLNVAMAAAMVAGEALRQTGGLTAIRSFMD